MTTTSARHPDPIQIHASALVIDTHADTPQRFVDESWDFVTSPLSGGMLNLATARRGNLAAEFFAIWPEPAAWRGRFAERTRSLIDGVLEQVRRHPAELALCTSPADILATHAPPASSPSSWASRVVMRSRTRLNFCASFTRLEFAT
jgi:hypothetical protein